MPIPSGQSGHAKETSPGRRGQVQGYCIRVRWQVHGTAAVLPAEGRNEGSRAMDLLYTDFPRCIYSGWEVSVLHILP